MSGIYGIFRFDGGPAPVEWLERMRSAMGFYGPDGGGQWVDGPVGLGFLLKELNPEDAGEAQPWRGERGPVVTAARLDNREQLLAELGAPAGTPDGKLVSLGFDRWGEAVCEHLEGDWTLAGWDARAGRLLLGKDAIGNATLYYCRGEGFVAFATSLRALLALPGMAHEPELEWLAEVLLAWHPQPELTAYKGFLRLLWAHAMSVEARGESRLWRYWSAEGREPLRLGSDAEYVEGFLELYTRAVRSCLRTNRPVAATLSGGRDSGSVVALAAGVLAEQGRGLTAYTSVPLLAPDGAGNRRMGDEWELAHATAAMAGGNVGHVAVDAAGYGVVDGMLHVLEAHDGPSHAPGNHYWLQAICESVKAGGAEVVLTGALGNAAVSWRGNGVAALALRQGRLGSAWRLFFEAERSFPRLVYNQVVRPALLPARRLWKELTAPGGQAWRWYSAINPRLAERLRIAQRMRAEGYSPTFLFSLLQDQQLLFFEPRFGVGSGIWPELGARHGLSFLDPTMNRALVEFMLRVPDEQFRHAGQSSWLFQRAFKGRLPEAVLRGRRKGLQAADIGHRLLLELPALRGTLDALEAHPTAHEVLDMRQLRGSLERLAAGVDPATTASAHQILTRGLGVGLFLLRMV